VVIVDTTVWIDYFEGTSNPETDWLEAELDRQRLGLTDIILCEVLHGVRDESTAIDVERRLLKLEVFESGGVDMARESARNYRILRSRGYTVRKTIDCLIATFCIRAQHSLLHRDRDFDPFETFLKLSVVHAQRICGSRRLSRRPGSAGSLVAGE
jgi:predicted nucleic acid-binding protein